MVLAGLVVANPKRICRIEISDPMIFNDNLGNSVIGCGQNKAMIESDFQRPGLQVPIPFGCSIS
jgi:hypothetical protein